MKEFTKEIKKHYGILSKTDKGWTTEVNLVSWNGNQPKVDIRSWSPDHEKAGKGVTLTDGEVQKLKLLLEEI